MEYGLYVHLPYCKSRCRYCDFYSTACGEAGTVPDAYIDALLRDFERYAPRDEAGESLRPQSVYLGGGTPSLLSAAQVQRLLQVVRPAPGAEVTLEANPDAAPKEKLRACRQAGVNRLSLGVQSARDGSLARLGRRHTAAGAAQALKDAREAGFENLSGDIMLALPHYTRAEFDDTLALLAAGGACHISAYLLKVEPGTPFGSAVPEGLPTPDEAADFYLYAVERLAAAGYAQYEISNFARPGLEGRHNLTYWDAGNWLGLGPSAHSCLNGRRFSFAPDLAAFLADAAAPLPEGELDAEDYIMLRLRLAGGLDEAALRLRFGTALTAGQRQKLDAFCQSGHARKTPGGWALTPEGLLVQNTLLGLLLGG